MRSVRFIVARVDDKDIAFAVDEVEILRAQGQDIEEAPRQPTLARNIFTDNHYRQPTYSFVGLSKVLSVDERDMLDINMSRYSL